MAQAVAERTFELLKEGPIPRRQKPFPRWSMAHVDACATIDAAEFRAILGEEPPPEPELGNWVCYWDFDTLEASVEFGREWLEPPEEDEKAVTVVTRSAVRDVDDDACSISINGREYRTVDATHPDWIEVATVTLTADDDSDEVGADLCDRVDPLAVAVAAELPPV
jgi:hypothetical protein